MTDTPKRGRPPKGQMKVKKAETIHDGAGGFLPVGDTFILADEEAAELLKARGLAE